MGATVTQAISPQEQQSISDLDSDCDYYLLFFIISFSRVPEVLHPPSFQQQSWQSCCRKQHHAAVVSGTIRKLSNW